MDPFCAVGAEVGFYDLRVARAAGSVNSGKG